MGKYSISDFQVGDSVYHLSNRSLKMVIIEINNNLAEITCRWVDKTGKCLVEHFLAQELGKSIDLNPKFYAL